MCKNKFTCTVTLSSGIKVETYNTPTEARLTTFDKFSSMSRSYAGVHTDMLWSKKLI